MDQQNSVSCEIILQKWKKQSFSKQLKIEALVFERPTMQV